MKPKNPHAVALGRIGGRATSTTKAEAARRNGKKGGRLPDARHAFVLDRHDAPRVRYGQEDIAHCAICGQAEDRPIHRDV